MFVPLTPLEFRRRAERLFGSKVGVIDGEVRFTYAEFGDRSRRLAAALLGLGVTPGDVVSFLTHNSHYLLEAYFGPEAIRAGWFHTGDLATVDGEGYLNIVDRKKDIIISGGENISSVEVENALSAHAAVYECAVVAVPDARWGEVPKALVVLKPGAAATEEALIQFCRERLAHFKAPKSVEFLDALPKSGTGKVLKAELRARHWAGRTRRVN